MLFTQDTIDNFTKVTGFDVQQFLVDFIDFNENHRQNIIDYYGGISSSPDAQSFDFLNEMMDKSRQILGLISINKLSFTNFADWNMLELIEDINTKLETTSNSSKYLRSAISKNNFSPDIQVNMTLKQGQTLERFSKDVENDDDPQNDWVNIAWENNLKEEDYTPEGGNLLKVTFKNGSSLFINSVIDNIDSGEKTYGLDINKVITFVNNDLMVLSYKETLIQSISILSQLRQNDNPEFPLDGFNEKLVVGSNVASLTYPSLFRQLYNTFAKDDSLKSFAISNIRQESDAVFLEYTIETRFGEVVKQSVSI